MLFLEASLNTSHAALANGFDAVCGFVNDEIDQACLEQLAQAGVKTIALRCAGFNDAGLNNAIFNDAGLSNADLHTAEALNMNVVRVPEYFHALLLRGEMLVGIVKYHSAFA